ncbi:MAG: hypothetical protein Q9182_002826 [Xanthomendoza sp. 2 TL-2023]
MDLYDDDELDSTPPASSTPKVTSEVSELLAKVPHRTVTDILIQHFLTEANWIYEMVDPTTFLERYDDWWSHPCRNAEDVEFAALLLRLCSYTAQFLPSQNYTADTILGASLSTIRQECDANANALASTQFVKLSSISIARIHQLFFRACYLKNEGNVKGSWDVLSEATREAQELGLHLDLRKGQGKFISEYDVEMGKRTYWNLWLWDKFMSIILATEINAPDTFCERKLQIQLTKLAAELLSPTDGKQSRDPVVIDNHVNRFYAELIDTLPPAFRIHDPELKWDHDLPNLKRQREMFRISIFATLCSVLKPLILTPTDKTQAASASGKKLVARLKTTLIEAIMELLDSVGRLHTLMGGKQNRFFLLSFFTLHPAALLGMCLLSLESNLKVTKQAVTTTEGTTTKGLQPIGLAQYSEQGRQRMESSIKRLRMLSEVSSIARTGLLLLEKIMAKLNDQRSNKSLKEATAPQGIKRKATASGSSTRVPISPVSEHGYPTTQTNIPSASTIPTTINTNNIFDQPSHQSLTPPDSHSDRSHNSPQMEMEMEMGMEIPDTWINLDEWSDGNGNPNPSTNPVIQNLANSTPANWDLTLFESEFEKTIEAQLATFSGPSVQWPCHPQSWALPITNTTTTTTASASNVNSAANAWSIPTTATAGHSNDMGMGPDAIMAMEQDIDWGWTGYGGG